MNLHFVRHGETDWNREGRMQGQTKEVSLNDTGRAQAGALAEQLARFPIELILASDLNRAKETASILSSELRLPLLEEPALREQSFGVAEGRLYADVRAAYGEQAEALFADPQFAHEGGESWAQLYVRLASFLGRLEAEPPAKEILLVTHGGPMRVAYAYFNGLGPEHKQIDRVANAAVASYQI